MEAALDEPAVWRVLPASRTGYIVGVDSEELLEFAETQELVVRMERGMGEHVIRGAPLVARSAGQSAAHLADREVRTLLGLFTIGRGRTVEQDAAFGLRQMVDMAVKALSPAVNSATTVITAIDNLAAVLAALTVRRVEDPHRMLQAGCE